MTDPAPSSGDPRRRRLDEPRTINRLVYGLYSVCALLFLADLFYHKHVHFRFEEWIGFFAVIGFVSCVGLVGAAKALRVLVKRREDYYDR